MIGLFGIAAALNGFLMRRIPAVLRILLAGGGLAMMIPGTLTDVIGIVILGFVILYQYLSRKRTSVSAA